MGEFKKGNKVTENKKTNVKKVNTNNSPTKKKTSNGSNKVKKQDDYTKELKKYTDRQKELKKQVKQDKSKDVVDKKKLKSIENDIKRRRKAKSQLPKTTQLTIPYIADYSNGLIEIAPNTYSKSYDFTDINYQVAILDDQIDIFVKWGELLNYFGSDIGISYTINNKPINVDTRLEQYRVNNIDGHENEINALNELISTQFLVGRNDIQKEKYWTVTIEADSPTEAQQKFIKIDNEVTNNFARVNSVATLQTTERRLEILHDFYRPNNIGELHINWENIKNQGISSKDFIAPCGIEFKPDYFVVDDVYYRSLYLTNLPTRLTDDILSKLTNFNFAMMTTVTIKSLDTEKAIRLVKRQLTGMEGMMIDSQKKSVRNGYDPELSIPHELKYSYDEAKALLESIKSQNQKLFFSSVCFVISGNDLQELEENYLLLSSAARTALCQVLKLKFQQEDGLKQVLPLGHNILQTRRTLTTESLSVFIPFTSQELIDDGGIYYSLNKTTKNLVMVNRKKLNNPNGFVLGESGSGKSFVIKQEIATKYLSLPNENIFIIDPENEYSRLVKLLGGQVIDIEVGSNTFINLLDMDENYSLDSDPVAEKTDFILSVCNSITRGLTSAESTIVDRVCGMVYMDYIQDFDDRKLPTFVDFYEKVKEQKEPQAQDLALALEKYATGSLSIFSKKTNVDLNNRLVCFNINGLGRNLRDLGLLVVSELIWNKLCANRNKISTSVYIDEFHLMFNNPTSEDFADQLYARIRKYGGQVTGITQNVDKLLQSEKARGMLSNSLFTIMLSQSDTNRSILSKLFSIGSEQLSFITNADKGNGLIRAGGVIVPFGSKFPKDNYLYKYLTSDPEEIKMYDELDRIEKLEKERNKEIKKKREELKNETESQIA